MSNKQMDGYVWRVPTLVGVMAAGALLLFGAAIVATIAARQRSSTIRLTIVATLGVLALLAGVAIRITALAIARTHEIDFTYVDPGPIGYLAPVMFATLAWVVGWQLLHASWTSRSALRYYVWVFVFISANAVDLCSPGWCSTLGFPFAWQSWSDVTFNDDVFRALRDVFGGILNLGTFVAIAVLLTRGRVPRPRAVSGPTSTI